MHIGAVGQLLTYLYPPLLLWWQSFNADFSRNRRTSSLSRNKETCNIECERSKPVWYVIFCHIQFVEFVWEGIFVVLSVLSFFIFFFIYVKDPTRQIECDLIESCIENWLNQLGTVVFWLALMHAKLIKTYWSHSLENCSIRFVSLFDTT